MARNINASDASDASDIDAASRADRRRASEGGSFLFPVQTAKGDARLLEAVTKAVPAQPTSRSEPGAAIVRVAGVTAPDGRRVTP